MNHSQTDDRSEEQMLRAIKSGSAAGKEQFVRTYWPELHRVAYLLLHDKSAAEDVAQESILSALNGLGGFEVGRPVRPWIRRIAVNRAIDAMRASAIRPELVAEGEAVSDLQLAAAADEVSALALSEEITGALSRLPEPMRVAVVLRHLFDYRPAEIAEMTGAEPATVRTNLHRGLIRLRQELTPRERSRA